MFLCLTTPPAPPKSWGTNVLLRFASVWADGGEGGSALEPRFSSFSLVRNNSPPRSWRGGWWGGGWLGGYRARNLVSTTIYDIYFYNYLLHLLHLLHLHLHLRLHFRAPERTDSRRGKYGRTTYCFDCSAPQTSPSRISAPAVFPSPREGQQ